MTLVGHVLDLTVAVLTYDFIGISNAEDPGEENTNIQVPNSWKVGRFYLSFNFQALFSVFVDGMPMSLLLPLYEKLPKRFIEKVLTVGVQLASIRRSFFTAQDRALYLTPLVEAVKAIATNPQKLEEPASLSAFTLPALWPHYRGRVNHVCRTNRFLNRRRKLIIYTGTCNCSKRGKSLIFRTHFINSHGL